MNTAILASVALVVDMMTDDELATQALMLALGQPHEGRLGCEKIITLLTENGRTKMHEETAQAFIALADERLG